MAKIFLIPAVSNKIRTEPPATTPVPARVGFMITFDAPYCPKIGCAILKFLVREIRIRLRLPSLVAFFTASSTSLAYTTHTTTRPLSLPTITKAPKRNFLPPFTTFVIRLTYTILWTHFKVESLFHLLRLVLREVLTLRTSVI